MRTCPVRVYGATLMPAVLQNHPDANRDEPSQSASHRGMLRTLMLLHVL
jgi:hypothetical protein